MTASRTVSPGECAREMARRIRTLWWLKMPGTMAGIAVFFAAYFWVLRHPFFPVTVMPLTALDRAIVFRPETLPLYLSLWAYVALLPALAKNVGELLAYAWRALVLGVTGLGIFVVWPTAVPVRDIDWAQHAGYAWLKEMDATGNACPSLHVAFAVFSAVGLARVLRETRAGAGWRWGNGAWGGAICYSTLATGQHVVLDVLAGAVLGVALAWKPRG